MTVMCGRCRWRGQWLGLCQVGVWVLMDRHPVLLLLARASCRERGGAGPQGPAAQARGAWRGRGNPSWLQCFRQGCNRNEYDA